MPVRCIWAYHESWPPAEDPVACRTCACEKPIPREMCAADTCRADPWPGSRLCADHGGEYSPVRRVGQRYPVRV